jgi:hypothetical protein
MKGRKLVFFVNRRNRKRHTTEECRALELTRRYLEAELDVGYYEGLPQEEIPTYETRVVRIETNDADELAALEAFTIPCQWCVPGARDLARHVDIDFED